MHFPHNTADVQEIVRNARKTGKGLVAVSSEAPHIHGASENPEADTICFSEMKRIIRLDRRSRFARVEPGVTFGELIPKLRDEGMRLNLPFLARQGKSVVSGALEREAILIPKYQYDFPDPLLTVETVFGTGDDFRTGSAAGPGTYEENKADKVLPWGPGGVDYLRFLTSAQGTIGLVTWATLKTEILPSASRLFIIGSEDAAALVKLAELLCLRRIPDECIILNRENFALAFSDNDAEESLLSSCAPWVMLCRVCGFDRYPEERVEIYSDYVREACAGCGLRAETESSLLPGIMERIERMLTDCDRREVYWKFRKGEHHELDLCCAPDRASEIIEAIEQRMPLAGLTVQPQVQGRAFRIEVDVRASGGDEALFELAKELMAHGAYFDRPYGRLRELVYTEPVSVEAMRKLKRIFDPDNILNPGRLCF